MTVDSKNLETSNIKCSKKSTGGKGGKASRKRLLEELENLKKKLSEERKKSEEYGTQLKYLQAEFDNYAKRINRKLEERIKRSNEEIILKILPILDDLEMAIEASKNEHSALKDGVNIILNKLINTLNEESLSEIIALGKPFDPNKHEAVGYIETSDYPEGVIVKVLRKGYILNGLVLRPSLVEVSKFKDYKNNGRLS